MAFKSSQNHARPTYHIPYTKKMTTQMTMTVTVTKAHTKTKTHTKCLKDPSHDIFSKSEEFKDIKYVRHSQ